MTWSAEERCTLRKMVDEGFEAADIAKALGKTRGSVYAYIHRHGVDYKANKQWRPHETALLIEMVGQGKSAREIGKALGRSEGNVSSKMCRIRLQSGVKADWRGADWAKVAKLAESGILAWKALEVINARPGFFGVKVPPGGVKMGTFSASFKRHVGKTYTEVQKEAQNRGNGEGRR